VLWGCDSERETRRVRELQTAVAAFPFEPRPGVTMSLSISAGSARFPEDGSTFDELLSAADERMYHDKATRRSRSSTRHSADTGRLELA
jgi:diguanylate cyclase (GGDEF)-like protein